MVRPMIRRLAKKFGVERPIRCDETVSIQSLLYSRESGSVSLPCLPQQIAELEENFEFAAASLLERIVLGALVRRHGAKRIFEIGTFRGITAVTMASNAGEGGELFTLDLPPEMDAQAIASEHYSDSHGTSGFHQMAQAGTERHLGAAIEHYTGACSITQLYGDSTKKDLSEFAGAIDLFFVDGCHEYAGALADTKTAWVCLRPGGLIVWHDYTWGSVQKAVADAALGVRVTHVRGTSIAFGSKPGG